MEIGVKKKKRAFDALIDDQNWSVLFNTHFQTLQSLNAISTLWINGFSKLGIDNNRRPLVEDLTKMVREYTGFEFIQTSQSIILEQVDWYTMIADYKMPVTNFVRTPEELDYCDEPDYWHDVMGHIPFLAVKEYADMYRLIATTYLKAFYSGRKDVLRKLDFIGGMIIELGLIEEPSGIKAFGATFYSSTEVEQAYLLENQLQFTIEALDSGETYDRHSFQGKYYIFNSLEELVQVIKDIGSIF